MFWVRKDGKIMSKVLGAIKAVTSVCRTPRAQQILAQRAAKPLMEGGKVVKSMEDVAGVITRKCVQTPLGKFVSVNGFNDAGKLVEAYGFIGPNGQRVVLRPNLTSVITKDLEKTNLSMDMFFGNCSQSCANEAATHMISFIG